MSKEFQEHLFEPFTQESHDARSTYNGTGLGMAIVKNLLDKMGGTIDFSSEKDVGTTYRITIPFCIDHNAASTSEAETSDEEISLSGYHILLAEDNLLNLEIAEFILTDAGAVVTKACNGEEALQLFMEASRYHFNGYHDAGYGWLPDNPCHPFLRPSGCKNNSDSCHDCKRLCRRPSEILCCRYGRTPYQTTGYGTSFKNNC